MPFSDLPVDVLRLICLSLYDEIDYWLEPCALYAYRAKSALARLSAVNSTFCSIAQPLLFRNICDLFFSDVIGNEHHLFIFLRTVIERPDLAAWVRRVCLCRTRLQSFDTNPFKAPIRALGLPFDEEWICRLDSRKGDSLLRDAEPITEAQAQAARLDGIFALFLAFLPNLTRIRISWEAQPQLISTKVLQAVSSVPGCSNIRSARISTEKISHQGCFRTGILFLGLPQIRQLTVASVVGDQDSQAISCLQTGSSSITELELWYIELDKSSVVSLLRACRALKRLSFKASDWNFDSITAKPIMPSEVEPITPRELIAALETSQSSSLEFLDLDFGEYYDRRALQRTDSLQITSFKGLSHLKVLYTSQECLLEHSPQYPLMNPSYIPEATFSLSEILPQGLETLLLSDADLRSVAPIEELAQACAGGNFPHLKEIYIYADPVLMETYEALTPVFNNAGVCCYFVILGKTKIRARYRVRKPNLQGDGYTVLWERGYDFHFVTVEGNECPAPDEDGALVEIE